MFFLIVDNDRLRNVVAEPRKQVMGRVVDSLLVFSLFLFDTVSLWNLIRDRHPSDSQNRVPSCISMRAFEILRRL